MRILVLTINYWPEQTGIGAVLTRRCEHLASAGHQVTVCTGMPYYPEWRVHARYRKKIVVREWRNGVRILRSKIWVPQKLTSLKRVLFEASFLASSFLRAFFTRKPDLLLVVSPPLGLGLSAVLLGRWWGIPYVFDVEDLQPDAAATLGMLPGPVLPLLYKLEALAYRHAAMVSTLTEGMRQRIVAKGVAEEKVVVLPFPADTRLFYVGDAIEGVDFRVRHNLVGKFVVAHSGNMGVKQGLEVVLRAAALLKQESRAQTTGCTGAQRVTRGLKQGAFKRQPEIVFLLVGSGAMKERLEEQAVALGLDNVRFLPLQQDQDFLQMLAATDLALIVQQRCVADVVFPSKTVTVLAAARPVIASVSADSEIARVIGASGGGVVIEPGEPELLAATIKKLYRARAKRAAMGAVGREYALRYWDGTRVLPYFEAQVQAACGDQPEQVRAFSASAGAM